MSSLLMCRNIAPRFYAMMNRAIQCQGSWGELHMHMHQHVNFMTVLCLHISTCTELSTGSRCSAEP